MTKVTRRAQQVVAMGTYQGRAEAVGQIDVILAEDGHVGTSR